MKYAIAAAALATLSLLAACEEKAKPAAPEPVNLADAERCFRVRDYPCAEKGFAAYLRQYPADPQTNAKLALTRTALGDHRGALEPYRKAAEGGVATYDFFANYAKSLEITGDLEGAIRYNREALKVVPELVDVRGSLANELVRAGKPDEALKLLQDFDRKLVAEGEPAYFTQQIDSIKARMAEKPAP